MLARSLCEAKRPSDLKVPPFDTMRPPDVCCWRRTRDRTRESSDGERERGRRKHSERDMRETIRNCEERRHRCSKTVVKKKDLGGSKNCQDSQKAGKEGKRRECDRESLRNTAGRGRERERWIQRDRRRWRMRPGVRDDTGRSDDRLKYTEDRQATGSWQGYGENTHLHFTQGRTHPSVILHCFLSGLILLAQAHTSTQVHAQTCRDLTADPALPNTTWGRCIDLR